MNEVEDKHLSLGEWHKCHAIYCTVLIRHTKSPDLAIALLKYQSSVQRLAELGGDWLFYDRSFRQWLPNAISVHQWAQVSWELWHEALAAGQKASREQNSPRLNRDQGKGPKLSAGEIDGIPKGWCVNYHNEKGPCRNKPCRYSHRCSRCGGEHRQKYCRNEN